MLFNVPITKQVEPSNMKSGKPRKLGRVQKIFIFKGGKGGGGGSLHTMAQDRATG